MVRALRSRKSVVEQWTELTTFAGLLSSMAPFHCRWPLSDTLYYQMCLKLQSHGISARR